MDLPTPDHGSPESSDAAYPAPPWNLRGDLVGTVLRMPPGTVPGHLVPRHLDITRRDNSSLLAAAWVDYRAGSELCYREFMVSAIIRLRPRIIGTVLRIWVDSPASRRGGRELWDIPKDLAEFSFDYQGSCVRTSAAAGGEELASYTYRERGRVPVGLPFGVVIAQEKSNAIRRTASSWKAHLATGSGRLTVPASSELSFLTQGRPLAHLALRDFRTTFGRWSRLEEPATPRTAASRGGG